MDPRERTPRSLPPSSTGSRRQSVTGHFLPDLMNRRIALIGLLLAYPLAHAAAVLLLFYDVNVGLARTVALCFSMEHLAPILYGFSVLLLINFLDASRRPVGRLSVKAVGIVFILGLGVVRAAQTVALVQSRYFLTREGLAHAEGISYVLTWANVVIFGSCLVVPLIAIGVFLLLRHTQRPLPRRVSFVCAGGLVLLTIAFQWVGERRHFFATYSNEYGLSRGPEQSFFRMLFGRSKLAAATVGDIPRETRRKLQQLGLSVHADQPFPFTKPRVFDPDLPPPWPAFEEDPDVIVVFVESLSAKLLGCYGNKWPDATRNINAFATRSLRFTNYFNHTTPTITGLHGSLCSMYEVVGYSHWDSEESRVLSQTDVLSLADVLSARGYETSYLCQGSEFETHKGEVLRRIGFRKRLFKKQLEVDFAALVSAFQKQYPEYHSRHHLSDILMFRMLNEYMRRPSANPRLVCMSTVGSHFPYGFGERIVYEDGKRKVLNSLRILDTAFAGIQDLLRDPTRKREIVFVLTADHAMFPTLEHIEIRGPEYTKSYYDRIALLIGRTSQEKGRIVDTLGSSIDLTPTILHLLDVNVRNPFMGWSLLGERRKYTFVLGTQHSHLFFKTRRAEWTFSIQQLEEWGGARLDDGEELNAQDLKGILGYIRYMTVNGRIWPD